MTACMLHCNVFVYYTLPMQLMTLIVSLPSCFCWELLCVDCCDLSYWHTCDSTIVGVAEYCDKCVCLSVCLYVHEHISGHTCPSSSNLCVLTCDSVLLWHRCITLCISGFMDDMIFAHNEPYGLVGRRLQCTTAMFAPCWNLVCVCCLLELIYKELTTFVPPSSMDWCRHGMA